MAKLIEDFEEGVAPLEDPGDEEVLLPPVVMCRMRRVPRTGLGVCFSVSKAGVVRLLTLQYIPNSPN